ncbi:hypothetical protein, partial [Klebsiella pneumoniae]|uniref:hypothetical protein n=1 Tax=Klebsiella pneumoniae TaxID=573 RepID=UPI00358F3A68
TAAIADALQQRDLLLAEAGTGTGKTFAYLVPVLLSGLRSCWHSSNTTYCAISPSVSAQPRSLW